MSAIAFLATRIVVIDEKSGCYYGKSLDILQKIKLELLQKIYQKGSICVE